MKKLFVSVITLLLFAGFGKAYAQQEGFGATSGVFLIDNNTALVGAEAVFVSLGVRSATLNFTLPPNRTITSLEGTVSYKAICYAETLAGFSVDGKSYPMKIKLSPNGGSETIFIKFSTPISYTAGNGQIGLGNGQACQTDFSAQNQTTWEIQALIHLQ